MITRGEIAALLSAPDEIVSVSEKTIEAIDIKDNRYQAKFATIKESEVAGTVLLEDVNLSIGLVFEACEFKGPVVLKNIQAQGYNDVYNPNSQNLVFRNCVFTHRVQLVGKGTVIERQVLFEGCTFKAGIEIDGLKVLFEGLTIRKCAIEGKLDIFNVEAKQNISLASNSINAFTRIQSVHCSTLTILKANKFSDRFHISNCTFDSGIVFNEGVFEKEVDVGLVTTGKTGLQIHGAVFEKPFYVAFHRQDARPRAGIDAFYLTDSRFTGGIYVAGTNDLLADPPFVESITIESSADLKGDIVFRDLHVGVLSIGGFNIANLLFQDLFVNQIKIKGLINNAGLIFSRIKASYEQWYHDDKQKVRRDNALYIDDCNFGKAQFFQTDFSSFDKIVFHNNILTDISTSLVKWFTPSQLDDGENAPLVRLYKEARNSKDKERIQRSKETLIGSYRSKQEIYRQLKYSSQKQGDNPQALEFQRWEMYYYRKVVNLRRKNFDERLILWSSQSNNFGQSWLKAVGLFLAFSFLAYIPVGFLNSSELDYTRFAASWSDIGLNMKVIFYDNLKNWVVLMNPAHSLKDINDNVGKMSVWLYFWDFISRIVASYFLFQIVSAFRKFSK